MTRSKSEKRKIIAVSCPCGGLILRPVWSMMLTLIAATGIIVSSASVRGDETVNAAPVERFMDTSTRVIGWVDLSKVQMSELAEFVQTLHPNAGDFAQPTVIQQALLEQGVSRIYWVTDLQGLNKGPEAVIVPAPAEKIGAVRLILTAVAARADGAAVVDNGVILAGSKVAVGALQKQKIGNGDPAFLQLVNSIDLPHAIVADTSKGALHPLFDTLPQVTDAEDDIVRRVAELMKSVEAVALSGDLPPTRSRLQVVTGSPRTATELTRLINEWVRVAIGKSAESLTLTADGSSVIHETSSVKEVQTVIENLKLVGSSSRRGVGNASILHSLKHIALAMHNFHDVHGFFPPQALANSDGERLLSWRVLILPYLGEQALYQQFHLEEPWDSEHNRTLVGKMPDVFRVPDGAVPDAKSGFTRFVAPLTENSVFGRRGSAVSIPEILDGTSNTLMVVTAAPDKAVPWTKPADIEIDPKKPLASIVGEPLTRLQACMCDGSARDYAKTISADVFNALFSMNGKEVIQQSDLE